jgi:outer membrane protein TolC
MMMKTSYLFLVLLSWSAHVMAQGDTLYLLEYYQLLRDHHPVARQAGLLPEQAEAEIRKARGAFDPTLVGEADQKVFEGKNYYRHLDGGIQLMTLPGIEVSAGYEQGIGEQLNPEAYTPTEGLIYAGVAVPLGQGLLIDARRAALQQAKIFRQSAPVARQAMLNDLYFDATKAYWQWSLATEVFTVQQQAVAVAEQRFAAIKESYRFGDKPGIDTLEALIQLQIRQQSLLETQVESQTARLALSTFLWNEAGQPLEIQPSLRPASLRVNAPQQVAAFDSVSTWLSRLSERHPSLQLLRFKLAELEVERRFKADKLKPKVKVKYNLINRPILVGEDPANLYPGLFENNYKWGVSLSFPIFLREARGDLELTKLKQQDTRFKQDAKQLDLTNKVLSYLREMEALADQIDLSRNTVQNYDQLLEAEIFKFQTGESSLFLVNSRETKLIEAQIKLLSLQNKFRKAAAGVEWSAGVLAGS